MNRRIYVLTVLPGLIFFVGACGDDISRQTERRKQQNDQQAFQKDRISDRKMIRATFKVENMVQGQDTL